MFRSAFLVFITGWAIRFLIDKPAPGQLALPDVSDSMLDNFQQSFDIMKAGHIDVAFVFIWDAHYLVLSVLGGLLAGIVYSIISEHISRSRMRRSFLPLVAKNKSDSSKNEDADLAAKQIDEK